ncbi:MAG: hypothetical protein ACKO23_12140, partial [Gemmataceae bacterium]
SIDGKLLWTHRISAEATGNHELPYMFEGEGFLFLVEPINIGYRLLNLDSKTGTPNWSETIIFSGKSSKGQVDGAILHHISDGELKGWSLLNGKKLQSLHTQMISSKNAHLHKNHLFILPGHMQKLRLSVSFYSFNWQSVMGHPPGKNAWVVSCLNLKEGRSSVKLDMSPTFLHRKDKILLGKHPLTPCFRAEIDEKESDLEVFEDVHHICLRLGNRMRFVSASGIHQKKNESCQH